MKFKKLIVIMMLLTSIISSFAISASAKNNKDVEFSYSLPNEGYYKVYGEGQEKKMLRVPMCSATILIRQAEHITQYTAVILNRLRVVTEIARKMIRPLSMQVRKDV